MTERCERFQWLDEMIRRGLGDARGRTTLQRVPRPSTKPHSPVQPPLKAVQQIIACKPPRKAWSRLAGIPTNGLRELIERVAGWYELEPFELWVKTNLPAIAKPRQVAMYLLAQRNFSTPMIGRVFGGFHYTTVMYGIHAVQQRRAEDSELDEFLRYFEVDRKPLTRETPAGEAKTA